MDEKPDQGMAELLKELREEYNPPPATPRLEMWEAIQGRLEPRLGEVVSLEEARRARAIGVPGAPLSAARGLRSRYRRAAGWAVAAAAVLVLGLGIGIGRMTAPGLEEGNAGGSPLAAAPAPEALQVAAQEHLVHSESLLTLVRADARAGRVEPAVGIWAQSLLTQTRLLLDAQGEADPLMKELLEDLELVLAQIVGVANAESGDQARLRSELTLALNGLEEREVLPRIQAVVPAGTRFAGT